MLEALPVLFPIGFVVALVIERVFSARRFPKVRGWLAKGVGFFVIALILRGPVAGLLAGLVAPYALVDLRDQPLLGVLALVLVGGLLEYFLHRAFHRNDFLWRTVHQLHHSAERVDVAGFSLAHPLETISAVLLGLAVALVFGVSPLVGFAVGYFGFFRAIFSHINVKTPAWLGYIIQRPEQHCVHHERGVHAYNYGMPIFDLVFGTFRNPKEWSGEAGFYEGASKRTWEMLRGRDVSTT